MKLADSHIHLFRNGYPGRYGSLFPKGGEVAVYEAIRQVHGIGRALVVGFEGEPWSRRNNRYLATLAPSHSWMAPLAFCPASRAPRRETLLSWWRLGFVGISIYVSNLYEAEMIAGWPADIVKTLNDRRAIISMNCPSEQGEKLRCFFERLGNTRILLSHLGLPGTMRSAPKMLKPVLGLATIPHVGVKLSGGYACNDFPHDGLRALVGDLLQSYGGSRLYWGSDFSPALDCVTFAQTIEPFRGSPEEIFSRNLQTAISRVPQGVS